MPTPGFAGYTAEDILRNFPGSTVRECGLFEPISSPAGNGPVKRLKKSEMAPALFVEPATWVIPVRLESEMNRRGSVKGQSARNRTVKNAVYRALGPHWKVWGPFGDRIRAGQPCEILAIRLGGTGLDMGGLWAAMKFPEDAIANLMGVDDGWPAWKAAFRVNQEPGPRYGLRIEMRYPVESPPLTKTDGRVRR